MAKTPVVCPFSRKLCRECALFRGRHYYLCFDRDYRGYVEGSAKESAARDSRPVTRDYRV